MRLVIADDEGLIRDALAALLELEDGIEVVGHAGTGLEAIEVCRAMHPDLVILDLEMPGLGGIEAAEQILAHRQVPVVIVTRHARPATLRRALEVGVRGFVPKTVPAHQLVRILREVGAGARYIDPDIAASALTEDECPLTARELELLALARTGAPVADIARSVHLSEGTVRNYLSSAMMKLNARTRHEAANLAWAEGWI